MQVEIVRRKPKIPNGWLTAKEIEQTAVPGDIIEIKFHDNSHFVFNIRKGWCVHVRPVEEGDETVVKDTTDIVQEASYFPCRINNFGEFAKSKALSARSLKECLQLSRAGLASGSITLAVSDIPLSFDNSNISQEFCFYWKYKTKSSSLQSIPWSNLLLVVLFAACSAGILAFL